MKQITVARVLAAGIAATMWFSTAAFGAVDMFLKIDGIEGESTDARHPGAIDVQGYSFDVTAPTSTGGGGGGAGKVSMSDLSVMKRFDKASPKLMEACANGKHFPKAVLTCRKAGTEQHDFFTVTMSDVQISSLSSTGSSGDDVPTESLSLNFAKIEFRYRFQSADGTAPSEIVATYDLKANKK
jgi:type VI secretion system secreted protein Hcp